MGKKKGFKQPKVDVPEGDIKHGKSIFESQCSVCHALQGDSKNAAAPALSGIIGRKSGEGTNFPYSKAMKNAGFVWSDKHIFMYLLNPGKYIPGNKMSFAGIAEEQDRADVIAYLLDN